MTEPIILENGLHGRILRLDDPKAKPAFDALQRGFPFLSSPSAARLYHAVIIRVEDETVYLIVPRQDHRRPVKVLTSMLKRNLRYALGRAPAIVYNNECHLYGERTAHIICMALTEGRKPTVQAVLSAPDEKLIKW